MSADFDFTIPDPGSLKRGRFTNFPVAPGRLEFAAELRKAILESRPQAIAVELPGFLRESYLRAIDRLPEMSVLLYSESGGQDEERAIYLPVEPADPFTEAIRSGREID